MYVLGSQKNVTRPGVSICGLIYHLNRGKGGKGKLGETNNF